MPKKHIFSLGATTQTFGIILRTELYGECVSFYQGTLGIPVWYEKSSLVCLRFGDGYLVIETGGMKRPERKSDTENPTMLRFNVEDVSTTAAALVEKGVAVEVNTFDWGTVDTFTDPAVDLPPETSLTLM